MMLLCYYVGWAVQGWVKGRVADPAEIRSDPDPVFPVKYCECLVLHGYIALLCGLGSSGVG